MFEKSLKLFDCKKKNNAQYCFNVFIRSEKKNYFRRCENSHTNRRAEFKNDITFK